MHLRIRKKPFWLAVVGEVLFAIFPFALFGPHYFMWCFRNTQIVRVRLVEFSVITAVLIVFPLILIIAVLLDLFKPYILLLDDRLRLRKGLLSATSVDLASVKTVCKTQKELLFLDEKDCKILAIRRRLLYPNEATSLLESLKEFGIEVVMRADHGVGHCVPAQPRPMAQKGSENDAGQ